MKFPPKTTLNHTTRATILAVMALTAITASALPAGARAAPAPVPAEGLQHAVFLGDLDLDHASGAGAALARIRYAAATVCGAVPLPFELQQTQRRRACIQQATEDAVRDLGAPRVTARYYHAEPMRLLAAR
jgi:UrcA family protein